MKKKHKWEGLTLETPGKHRIRVQGRIDDHWAERLGGMAISYDTFDDKPTVGGLVGSLPDQAALSGVLNTLYDLRLPLLSVENLDEKPGPSVALPSEPRRDPFKTGAHHPSTCRWKIDLTYPSFHLTTPRIPWPSSQGVIPYKLLTSVP